MSSKYYLSVLVSPVRESSKNMTALASINCKRASEFTVQFPHTTIAHSAHMVREDGGFTHCTFNIARAWLALCWLKKFNHTEINKNFRFNENIFTQIPPPLLLVNSLNLP